MFIHASLRSVTQDEYLSAPAPAPEEILFKYFFPTFNRNNNSHKQIYGTPYVYADVPVLSSPALRIPPHHDHLWTGTRPPALICPICRVRNNKSAAKNKRCENCCQFAKTPPRCENSGKILFQQIKSTCGRVGMEGRGREGSQGCKLWGSTDGFVGFILPFKCATHGCQFRISWPQAIRFTELSPLVCSRIRVRDCAQRLSHAVMLRLEQSLGMSRSRGSSKWLCASLGPNICCEMWH